MRQPQAGSASQWGPGPVPPGVPAPSGGDAVPYGGGGGGGGAMEVEGGETAGGSGGGSGGLASVLGPPFSVPQVRPGSARDSFYGGVVVREKRPRAGLRAVEKA